MAEVSLARQVAQGISVQCCFRAWTNCPSHLLPLYVLPILRELLPTQPSIGQHDADTHLPEGTVPLPALVYQATTAILPG